MTIPISEGIGYEQVHTGQAPGYRGFGQPGEQGTRLLAGPRCESGPESLEGHLYRLGSLPDVASDRSRFIEMFSRSQLRGRGGSSFPLARKLEVATSVRGLPLVVVNGSESEPASRKDAVLLQLRPHLVLDGAVLLAQAAGAQEVIVVLHRGSINSQGSVEKAIAERSSLGMFGPRISVKVGPEHYVSGEASAVVRMLGGHDAKPSFNRKPAALFGVSGRPTLVQNVETLAHLALVARFGDEWFKTAGSARRPGSTLVTLAGGVCDPGVVLEVMAPVPIRELLISSAGVSNPPPGLLLGGYGGGTWLKGSLAWNLLLADEELIPHGASIGCGLVGVLPPGACGIIETARLINYLARESAGQCGPCVSGLPVLAQTMSSLAMGEASRRDIARMHRLAVSITGRGACRHPDGVIALLESTFAAFSDQVRFHLKGNACAGANHPGVFPIPSEDPAWR